MLLKFWGRGNGTIYSICNHCRYKHTCKKGQFPPRGLILTWILSSCPQWLDSSFDHSLRSLYRSFKRESHVGWRIDDKAIVSTLHLFVPNMQLNIGNWALIQQYTNPLLVLLYIWSLKTKKNPMRYNAKPNTSVLLTSNHTLVVSCQPI